MSFLSGFPDKFFKNIPATLLAEAPGKTLGVLPMRKLIVLSCLLMSSFSLSAQTNEIEALKSELATAVGKERVEKMILLSELYQQQSDATRAIAYASRAFELAKLENRKALMALALNREGRALLMEDSPKSSAQAERKFQESLRLIGNSGDKTLKLENFNHLLVIAENSAEASKAIEIKKKIAALDGSGAIVIPEGPGKELLAPIPPPTPAERYRDISETNKQLNERLSSLNLQKAELEKILQNREQEIEEMTEFQMRQELLLARQKSVLDSLSLKGLRDSFLLSQQTIQLKERETQLQIERGRRNMFLAIAAIIIVIAIALYSRYLGIKSYNSLLEKKNEIIREEKQRSEELLLNILPAAIADELKAKGAARARFYPQASVLFADFENFSPIARKLSPEKLVSDLDHCFKAFDQIVEKYNLEKIKTIGDSYMAAGGLPAENYAHPTNMIRAALEMQEFLLDWKLEKLEKGEPFFEARIGIHTGPLVAGVVGLKKFAYDVWGDTVNIASRIESSGKPGQVNISGATYELVKEQFNCKYRGKVPAKNMGEIDMYFIDYQFEGDLAKPEIKS
jgi:adenylate cyclase